MYKCHSMGLLPTHVSDWLAFAGDDNDRVMIMIIIIIMMMMMSHNPTDRASIM